MANYNTFQLYDCNARKAVLITSSIRKCMKELRTGYRVDVWNGNRLVEKIYDKNRKDADKYIAIEKEYVKNRQEVLHAKKERRRERARQRLLAKGGANG